MSRRLPALLGPVLVGTVLVAGALTACGADPVRYVAIGDSFTAGPLIPPADDAGGCLRSGSSYPALVAAGRDDVELADVSCSGASTTHLTRPQETGSATHPPQLDALDDDTDLVTVSIGGNDDGTAGALLGVCQQLAVADPTGAPCVAAEAASGDPVSARLDRLGTRLVSALAAVQERAPGARVVVVGYPRIVPAEGGCPDLPLAVGDRAWAYRLNEALARTVRDAAAEADLEYVDMWAASAGHDICSADPWINGRTTDEGAALAYHPFRAYEQAVADRLLELL